MEEPVQVPERVLNEINHTVSLFHSCTKKKVKSEFGSEVVSGETSLKDFVEHVEEQRALFLQGCIAQNRNNRFFFRDLYFNTLILIYIQRNTSYIFIFLQC